MARPGCPVTVRHVPPRAAVSHRFAVTGTTATATAATGVCADVVARCADGPEQPADQPALTDTAGAGGPAVAEPAGPRSETGRGDRTSDQLAVGVHRAVRRQGLRRGTDVAVTRSDDSPPASAVDRGPTSARQPVEESARTAVDPLDSTNGGTSTTGDRGVPLPGGITSRGSALIRLTGQDLNEWESR